MTDDTDYFEEALALSKEARANAIIDRERLLFFRDSVRSLTVPAIYNKAARARVEDAHYAFLKAIEKEAM